jgi:hypothetical protein
MQIRRIIPIIVIFIFILVLSINIASAATATHATLVTTDADGNLKINFNPGETVYIRWSADGTVDITASKAGVTDQSWIGYSPSGVIAYTPTKGAGIYEIKCTGADSILIAYGTIFVIPELVYGTISAIIVSFGAFGLIKLKKKL